MLRIFYFLILSFFISQTALADINQAFERVRQDPNALYAFLKKMPKGGELHYHLAGGAYPENMLQLAAKNPEYCINLRNQSVYKDARICRDMRAYGLQKKPGLYRRFVNAWSMQDFIPQNDRSPHDHFFASFLKFIPIVADYHAQLIAEVVQRAGDQNALYMEIMDISDDARAVQFAPAGFAFQSMPRAREKLLADAAFQSNIRTTTRRAEKSIRHARELMGCAQHPERPACRVEIKLQYYVLREQAINAVFAQALNAFEAASRSDAIVGVNLVQPEDGVLALSDYRKQMQVFDFMHQHYPNVHITLHAGEITREHVTPEQLRFHIREAIEVGHAERIGHGVDIAQEHDADALLADMAKRPVPVEINLESNRVILGVAGKMHPLNYYLHSGVPVVLSTDDEGILRTDLTSQYVMAVMDHGIDYPTLRQINRNALTYSFMPGKSLWKDPTRAIPVADCRDLQAKSCLYFTSQSLKAKKQRQLELALQTFENG